MSRAVHTILLFNNNNNNNNTGVIPKSLSQSLTRLNLHPNTDIQTKNL